jgi:uncharacterized protein YdgA (DUF945 family)
MITYKSMMWALPITFVMYFYPALANEPSPTNKQLQENTAEEKQPQTTKPSQKTNKKEKAPPEKISLNYQINDQPISTAETTEDKPFAILSELFSKTLDVANKLPNQVVKTIVHIPYPEDMQKSFKEKLPNFVLQTTVEAPNGKTKTDFNLAAFNGEIAEKTAQNKKGIFEWAGLNGTLNYTGEFKNLSGNVAMPHFFIMAEDEFEVLLEKFSLSGTLNNFFEPIHFNVQLPTLKISSKEKKDNFTFNLNNLNGKLISDDQEILDGLRLGRASFAIDEMSFINNKDHVSMKGLNGESIAQINDPVTKKFINSSAKLTLNNLTMPPSLANGLTGISFELQTELNNLDAQVLADIMKTLRQLQDQETTPEMLGMALLGDLMKGLPKVVKGSPIFNVKSLAIKTNQGELLGNFSIGIDGTKPFSIEKVEVLKMAIKAQSSVKISKDILKKILVVTLKENQPSPVENEEENVEGKKPKKKQQSIKPEKMADEQIKQFIAQKFLVEEPKHYKLDAEFKGGKLFLNGQEIPLPF